jgi:hypothetical protein
MKKMVRMTRPHFAIPMHRMGRMRRASCPLVFSVLPPLPLLLLLTMGVVGCGVSGPGGRNGSGASSSQQGTLFGTVIASPTCPVERASDPCAPKRVAHRAVRIETPSGALVTTVTTDGQGQFSATLVPGTYVVRVTIVPGQLGMRQITPGRVTVVAGQTTSLTLTLDTGIR